MRCENGRRGFVAAMRSSIERRRVCNAKVTSLRQRKYQELTLQREQENLQRAKAILERRKSERDRLNAYMHSVGNPHAKNPDYFKRMRRFNTEGMIERPPWTDSLRNDYDTLIKLREKEIAVTTLRIENQKELPTKNLHSEVKGGNLTNGTDKSYLLKKGTEFHHDYLEPEFGHIDAIQKSNGSHVQNDLKVLKNELFAFTNEARRYHTDIGKNLLLMEPTVFREHSLNGPRSSDRSLPPTVPTSNLKVFTPPLKSCLKSNKHDQKFLSSPSETPRLFPQLPSERYMSQPAVTTSRMEADAKLVSNEPQTRGMATSVKAVKNHILSPDMFSWSDQQDMDYFKEYQNSQPDIDTSITEEIFVISTASNMVTSEEKVAPENLLPDPAVVRPISDYKKESESMISCSSTDPPVKEETPDTPSLSETAQRITSTPSTLPPRYTSTCESWQESKEFESSIQDEHPSPSPPRENEEKTWGSDEEIFMTSLKSEAATTRLIAEVHAVQSRLEDCKLKPLDFRNMFTEPPFPDRGRSRPGEQSRAETTLEKESGVKCTQLATDGYEIFHSHKGQGTIQVAMQNHEIFTPDDTRESNLNEDCREKESTPESVSKATGVSSVDDHENDRMTTANCGTNKVDSFTEMDGFEEVESRKILHGAAGDIPWKNEAQERRGAAEHTADPDMGNEQPADSIAVASPFPCTTATPPKPVRSTVPKQPRGVKNQHPFVKQTDENLLQNARCPLKSEGISTNLEDRAESTEDRSDCSLLSTKRTSKYLNNIGYRDLSEAPRPKYPKQHCFYSSNGLLQVGYSQPRQPPKPVKQNMPQNNKQGQPFGFHDSLGDKENYGMSGSDDQEQSILASLERLDWKLAAMSARVKNRASITPSMVSQNQNSIQSAPAATGNKGASGDGTPMKLSIHPLRPSSVRTQKPPTRNFRRRRQIVGVTNKFHQDDYD